MSEVANIITEEQKGMNEMEQPKTVRGNVEASISILMNIPYAKLGVDKDGQTDVLNVKIDDFMLKEFLVTQNGIYDGYHMAHDKWISVLLDGTVDINQIYDLINTSFVATSKKNKK